MARQRISKRVVDATSATGSEQWVWDTELRGFGLRVSSVGQKTYVVQYRVNGRTRRLRLGVHGTLTPDGARSEARRYLNEAATGGDPAGDRDRLRKEPSVCEAVAFYIDTHAKPKRAATTVKDYKSMLRRRIAPHFGALKLSALRRADVLRFHLSLESTPTAANRAVMLLSAAHNFAVRHELIEERPNPARGLERFTENKRQRFLDQREIERLNRVLDEVALEGCVSLHAVAAIRLLMLTGCRLSEILTLRWEWVDLERGLLLLPMSKTGRKAVYLADQARTLLKTLRREDDNPYVIVGQREGACLVNLEKPWRLVRSRAQLGDVRLHDLRHTFASLAAAEGASLPIIGALLGHASPTTTARYAHLAAPTLRLAVQEVGNRLEKAFAANQPAPAGSKVVLLNAYRGAHVDREELV